MHVCLSFELHFLLALIQTQGNFQPIPSPQIMFVYLLDSTHIQSLSKSALLHEFILITTHVYFMLFIYACVCVCVSACVCVCVCVCVLCVRV